MFPTDLVDLPNPDPRAPTNSAVTPLSGCIANLNAVVEALQAKVGVNGSTVPTSLEKRLTNAAAVAAAAAADVITAQQTADAAIYAQSAHSGIGIQPFGFPLIDGGWLSVTAGATISSASTKDGNALTITGGTTGTYINVDMTLPNPQYFDLLGLSYSAPTGMSQIQVYAAETSGFANYRSLLIGTASYPYSAQLNTTSLGSVMSPCVLGDSRFPWSVTGTVNASTLFSIIRIKVTATAGNYPSITLSRVVINPAGRGKIAIVADDGIASWGKYGIPALNKRQMKCSMAIIPSFVGQSGYMTLAQLQEHVACGHECVAHDSLAGNGDSAAVRIARWKVIRDYLRNNSLLSNSNQEKVIIYPGGDYQNDAGDTSFLDALLAEGWTKGRAGYPFRSTLRELHSVSPYGELLFPAIGHARSTTTEANDDSKIAATKAQIQDLATYGLTGILMLHKVIADQTTWTATSSDDIEISDLASILDEISTWRATGRLQVVRFSDL